MLAVNWRQFSGVFVFFFFVSLIATVEKTVCYYGVDLEMYAVNLLKKKYVMKLIEKAYD